MANYFIIGGDGKQYGPISPDELRRWISERRLSAQSQVQMQGTTEWRLLSEVPEFAEILNASAPPPLPSTPPAGTAKTSGLAITSLVLGILGVLTCGITVLLSAPIGLILGIFALNKIGKSQGQLRGKGLALAGVIMSSVTILLVPIFAAMMLPALGAARQKAQEINCINNEKQLALAVRIYVNNNQDHLPPAASWCDAIKASVGSDRLFKCPAADSTGRCDYAFNAKLGGMDQAKVNPQTVLIFESDAGWNANGGKELMIASARHRTRGQPVFVVALADGSLQVVSQFQLSTLRWDP